MRDMVFKLNKYFQILGYLLKINIMKEMAYPVPFTISCVAAFLTVIVNVLFINVSFGYVDSIAGWTFFQILGVLGSYMIIEGIMWVFFAQLNAINIHINQGTMDGILLKPIDSQFLVSFWKNDLEDSMRFIVGLVLIIVAVKNTIGFNFWHIILYLILVINGAVIFYSFTLFIRSFSFWIIDGSSFWLLLERISGSSQYPIDIYYNKIIRGIFTFVIPLAFVTTVPARILTNEIIDWKLVALAFLIGSIFFFGSRLFWKFSLKHYSSASS